MSTILVVTSAHWSGDPRLNRHVRYLGAAGASAQLISYHQGRRIRNVLRALADIRRLRPEAVILPDPELFVIGSLWARLIGIRVILDIHENYRQAAYSRDWIPRWLRTFVGLAAHVNDRLGRFVANGTVVAAPELATASAHVVLNIPNPADFAPSAPDAGSPRATYVGDVTEARGALDIARLAGLMPGVRFLVIGPVSDELKDRMHAMAGPSANLELTGKMAHPKAWQMARGSIAGLSLLRPYPAYREAVATKLWEYCASGLPPLVTDLPGQRQFVSYINPALAASDVPEMAAVLQRLASDRAWQGELADASRRLAEEGWEENRPDLALLHAVQP